MADTFILVTPRHLFSFKDYLSERYTELGVENARNIVGRIGNLWLRFSRIEKSLKDWEKHRREACQGLADSAIKGRPYRPEDRPSLLEDKKRAAKCRDEWHYKANLFVDIDKLFAQLPVLYVTEEELTAAKRARVREIFHQYNRRKRTARLKRQHQAGTKQHKRKR